VHQINAVHFLPFKIFLNSRLDQRKTMQVIDPQANLVMPGEAGELPCEPPAHSDIAEVIDDTAEQIDAE